MTTYILRYSWLIVAFAYATAPASAQWLPSGATTGPIYYENGRVGIGTSAPSGLLEVRSATNGALDSLLINTNAGAAANSRFFVGEDANSGKAFFLQYFNSGYTTSGLITANRAFFGASSGATNGLAISTLANAPILFSTAGAGTANERMRIAPSGNVGIGTATPVARLHVQGDAHFSGTVTGDSIEAKYQDVAEWVPASTDLSPGTVVVLNRGASNEVMASTAPYDDSVAGVVSARPGLSLGEQAPGRELIATTGRVRVRVDARTHPISVGDLLVTGTARGTAMRSEPLVIEGRRFHQPGTIIGKALEPLPSGIGEILVLLSLQ